MNFFLKTIFIPTLLVFIPCKTAYGGFSFFPWKQNKEQMELKEEFELYYKVHTNYELYKMMDSNNVEERLAAVHYLQKFPRLNTEELTILLGHPRDKSPIVREAIIHALRFNNVADFLIPHLSDTHPSVRIAAVTTLSAQMNHYHYRRNETWDTYVESLFGPIPIQDKVEMQQVIKQALLSKLSDSDYRVRMVTALSLSDKISDVDVRQALVATLSDPHPLVVRNAGFALWPSSKDPQTRQKILDILSDTDPAKKREIMVEYLILEPSGIMEKIHALLSDPHPIVRMAAVVAYGRITSLDKQPSATASWVNNSFPFIEKAFARLKKDPNLLVRTAIESWQKTFPAQETSPSATTERLPPHEACLRAVQRTPL